MRQSTSQACTKLVAEATIGHLTATADVGLAVNETDIALICVGTPGRSNGQPDTTGDSRRRETNWTRPVRPREAVHGRASQHLPAGHRRRRDPSRRWKPRRESGTSIAVGANPEFLREGTAIRDFYSPPMVLIGATTPETAGRIAALYR